MRWALQGRLRFPFFSGSAVWGPDQVTRLFDSIYRGYPIGLLTVWQRPASEALVDLGPITVNAPPTADALWVLDGSQRVLCLVEALIAPADSVDPRSRIFFDLRKEQFVSAGRRIPTEDHWLPVTVAWRNDDLLRWIRERPWLVDAEIRRCHRLVEAIADCEIPMYILEGDEDAIVGALERIDMGGLRRKQPDLRTVDRGSNVATLDALAARVRSFGFGDLSDDVLTQSLAAVQGDEYSRVTAYSVAERALGHTVDFLRDEASIPHARLIPHTSIVPVLARFASLFGAYDGRSAELLRRWVWRGSVVGAPSNISEVRRYVSAIHGDAAASANRLLQLLPPGGEGWVPDVYQLRLTSAQAKLNLLAFLAQRPVILGGYEDRGREFVNVPALLNGGVRPFTRIFTQTPVNHDHQLAESLANHVVQPESGRIHLPLLIAEGRLPPEVLASQCLDDECVALLRAADMEGFLRYRATLISDILSRNVQRHALFGFWDGPDLRSLFAAEEGDPDAT